MNYGDYGRLKSAANIIKEPHKFILCEGCGSISNKTLLDKGAVCSVCNGYAFTDDTGRITEQAKRLMMEKEKSVQRKDIL